MISFVCLILLFIVCVVVLGIFITMKITGYNFRCVSYYLSSKKDIKLDASRLGINNFFIHPVFGTTKQQFGQINKIGIKYVRVLFAWSQKDKSSKLDFSLYDDIVNSCPDDTKLLVVVAHSPEWFVHEHQTLDEAQDSWFNEWFRPVIDRYKTSNKIVGYEIWNEPDSLSLPSDSLLGLNQPENYMKLLRKCSAYITHVDHSKKIVLTATLSIQQNYPKHLDYNKKLVAGGAQDLVDVYNIHYYGDNHIDLLKTDGVVDFLNGLRLPIWVTETGANSRKQLEQFEITYNFFSKYLKNRVELFFHYIFTDDDTLSAYSMLDINGNNSDLYNFLCQLKKQ